ncbi:MAG: hypothetical protein V1734_06095 [Nanoarchaeota archaeon]
MKTRILALILISVIILSAAASANIMLPQNFLQKTPTGFKLVLPVRDLNTQQANIQPVSRQIPPAPDTSASNQLDELSKERMLEKEDELKDPIMQKPLELSNTAKASILQWYFTRYIRSRINIPPGATPAYQIELSPADMARQEFESVDMAKYRRFQSSNREIFAGMVWANRDNPAGRSIIYSQSTMQNLAHYIALLETGSSFPSSAPPAGFDVPWDGGRSMKRFYSEEEALGMWLPHLALTLYVEVNHIVPWTITSYTDYQKSLLLDSRKFINYQYLPTGSAYSFALTWENGGGLTGITDWNPFYSYDFLNDNSMIQPTQQETIYSLTQWMRENLYHEAASNAYANHLAYGYNGSYPVDKTLNPPSGQKHWTQGCSGTSSLYSAMLKTINIPVSINLTLGGHRSPLFLTADLALMHGDDPYGLANRRGLQEVPVEEIFVSIDEFYSMNHAEPEIYDGTHIPTRADMAGYLSGKRKYQNAYDSLAYALLKKRGEDVIMYLPNGIYNSTLGYWWLNESWRPIFDVEDVPVMLENLDNEILRIGGGDYTRGNLLICRGLIPRPGYC